MKNMQSIQDFLSLSKLALVGASRNSRKFGNAILKDLRQKGYQVFPVHPSAAELEGVQCYPALSAIPAGIDGLVICVPPVQTEKVIQEAVKIGVQKIWMQQGSESTTAIEYCRQNKVNVISGECILMFASPVSFPHSFHRWIWKLLGKLPK